MAYLLDAATLAEALRSTPSPGFVRRLTSIPPRDRWTSVVTVSQLLLAARRSGRTRLMQDVIQLVASVKVAPFDIAAAQLFAKLQASAAMGDPERVPQTPPIATGAQASPDDAMIAAIALANDFTLVTRRPADFARFAHLRAESWVG